MTEIRVDTYKDDTAVYVRKPDGTYIAVYVGDAYLPLGYVVNHSVSTGIAEEFGYRVWSCS